jgi:hypothetical protein
VRDKLYTSISGLEAQFSMLGCVIVDSALVALRQQLAAPEEQASGKAAPAELHLLVMYLLT